MIQIPADEAIEMEKSKVEENLCGKLMKFACVDEPVWYRCGVICAKTGQE